MMETFGYTLVQYDYDSAIYVGNTYLATLEAKGTLIHPLGALFLRGNERWFVCIAFCAAIPPWHFIIAVDCSGYLGPSLLKPRYRRLVASLIVCQKPVTLLLPMATPRSAASSSLNRICRS